MQLKTILTTLLLFIASVLPAQQSSYKKIDAHARSIKSYTGLKDLQTKLTKPYRADEEKARSIFVWVAENIAYDVVEYHTDTLGMYDNCYNQLVAAGNYNDKSYNALIVQQVLKKGKAICDGYSRVFKTLCDSAGLVCEVVTGAAKNSIDDIGTDNTSNHAWNAVKIDGKWKLVDATWCAGSCDDSTTVFTKEFSDNYFFPDPLKFSYNHFPDNKKWFLLSNPPSKATFDNYPLFYDKFFDREIQGISPLTGILKVKKGDKIPVALSMYTENRKMSIQENDLHVFDDRFKAKKSEIRFNYEYTIDADDVKKVTVYFENEAILTYKVAY